MILLVMLHCGCALASGFGVVLEGNGLAEKLLDAGFPYTIAQIVLKTAHIHRMHPLLNRRSFAAEEC